MFFGFLMLYTQHIAWLRSLQMINIVLYLRIYFKIIEQTRMHSSSTKFNMLVGKKWLFFF